MTDNKDLNQRFDKLEARLDSMTVGSPFSTFQNPTSRSDEIDLRELFTILWQGKWWIVGITFLFAMAGAAYALGLPSFYSSHGVYVPTQSEGRANMHSQLGGFAALAGINLGGGTDNDIEQAMALLTSWPFLEQFVDKYQLKPLVTAVKKWDAETERLVWDDRVYSAATDSWVEQEPSSFEVFKVLKGLIQVRNDQKSGLLTVEVEHFSPLVAKEWVELLALEINLYFKSRDKAEAQKNISFLKGKIEETSISELHAVFYEMVESQIKTLMLAEVGEEYLIRTVVEPKVAELQVRPKRKVIVIMFALFGLIISFVVLIVRKRYSV